MFRLMEAVLLRSLVVARFWLNEGHTLPGMHYLIGYWLESRGRFGQAVVAYERALASADRSSNRRMFKVRQKWQFALERVYHAEGKPRVYDPLFECQAQPREEKRVSSLRRRIAIGYYRTEWKHRGLSVLGFLNRKNGPATVCVYANSVLMRQIRVSRGPLFPSYFQLSMSRAAIAALPPASRLRVEFSDGTPLLCEGCEEVDLILPHGSGTVCGNGASPVLDKKGFLLSKGDSLKARQSAYLEVYAKAREIFEREFGTPLILLYGTLLGQHRGGDFIPGDDDFDVGYVSLETSPEGVKEEAKEMVLSLVGAGFTVTFNRGGRLFRLRHACSRPDGHLDVHAIWFDGGKAWIHPQACLACVREDFLPARLAQLRGVRVQVPRRPEAFLEAYYGEGWRIPDPAYSTAASRVPRRIKRHLARACVTPIEYSNMQRQLNDSKSASTTPGRLISIGSFSLYPLEEYEVNCDW